MIYVTTNDVFQPKGRFIGVFGHTVWPFTVIVAFAGIFCPQNAKFLKILSSSSQVKL
jgi:hypothetical protein